MKFLEIPTFYVNEKNVDVDKNIDILWHWLQAFADEMTYICFSLK